MRRPVAAQLLGTALLAALVAAGGAVATAGAAAAGKAVPPGASAAARFSVKVTAPEDGDFVFGKTKITAEVKSSESVSGLRVEFSVGGKLVFIDREAPYECFHDFGDQPRSYVIEAKAVSPDGLAATDVVVTRKLEINYREEVNRVVVTISVTDSKNQFIEGLQRGDFTVLEDNTPQQILEFGEEKRPITIGVLIDTSGSMKEEIKPVQTAAKDFVKTIRPEDRAFVVDLDENVFLLADMTNDHAALEQAIEGTDAEGGTALYDAIYVSYWKMKRIEGRKAIVALTDGEDTNSRFSYKKITELTRTSDVLMYTIGLGATVLDLGIRGSLKQLADDTGGRAFFPKTAQDLAETYQQIAADLRSQYYLTYSSSNPNMDGKWRAIRVECRNPEARLKARRGYYAVKR